MLHLDASILPNCTFLHLIVTYYNKYHSCYCNIKQNGTKLEHLIYLTHHLLTRYFTHHTFLYWKVFFQHYLEYLGSH